MYWRQVLRWYWASRSVGLKTSPTSDSLTMPEKVQVGRGLSCVHIVNEVIGVVPLVWWRRCVYRRG